MLAFEMYLKTANYFRFYKLSFVFCDVIRDYILTDHLLKSFDMY